MLNEKLANGDPDNAALGPKSGAGAAGPAGAPGPVIFDNAEFIEDDAFAVASDNVFVADDNVSDTVFATLVPTSLIFWPIPGSFIFADIYIYYNRKMIYKCNKNYMEYLLKY